MKSLPIHRETFFVGEYLNAIESVLILMALFYEFFKQMIQMKRVIGSIIFVCMICIHVNSYAQYYDPNAQTTSRARSPAPKGWDWKKVYPGGNAGLGFSGGGFFLQVSPLAGYWVTNWFTPGVMLTYIYFNYPTLNFRSNVVGISPFVRAFVLKWLFAHVEGGFFYGKGLLTDNNGYTYEQNVTLFSPLVGGGVSFPIGQRSGFLIMLLFNLNYKSNLYMPGVNQPYVVRFGFYF
jgi:hypothetical protein